MKKEITIYYKDSAQDEYVTRRVLTQDGNYYKLISYWKIGKKIETYVSGLKLTKSEANKYILQCRKENRFDHFLAFRTIILVSVQQIGGRSARMNAGMPRLKLLKSKPENVV